MLPRKVKTINGNLDLVERRQIDGPQPLWGVHLYGHDYKIEIKKDMKLNIKQQTLLHELIHTIENMHGLGIQEKDIEFLSTGLLFILQNNPKIVQFLTKK